jgi:hypothetical protein
MMSSPYENFRENRQNFLRKLVVFLENKKPARGDLLKLAGDEKTGLILGVRYDSYITGALLLEHTIDKLEKGNKDEWAKLLTEIENNFYPGLYERAKAISPFAKKTLIYVRYGFSNLLDENVGDLASLVTQTITDKKERRPQDGESYALVISEIKTEEVITL